MLVNLDRGIGFFNRKSFQKDPGLFIYYFDSRKILAIPGYDKFQPKAISPTGSLFVAISKLNLRGKTQLEVFRDNRQVIYSSTDRHYMRAEIDKTDRRILVETEQNELSVIDLSDGASRTVGVTDTEFYRGCLSVVENAYLLPSVDTEGLLRSYNFDEATISSRRLSVLGTIARIRICKSGTYVTTDNNLLYNLTNDWKTAWQVDFERYGDISASPIFVSDTSNTVVLSAYETKRNEWGEDFVVRVTDGKIVRAMQNYKGKGRVAAALTHNELLLFNGKKLDIETDEVSEILDSSEL